MSVETGSVNGQDFHIVHGPEDPPETEENPYNEDGEVWGDPMPLPTAPTDNEKGESTDED